MSRKLFNILKHDPDLEAAFLCYYKNPDAVDEEMDLVDLIEKKVSDEIEPKALIKELMKLKLIDFVLEEFELNAKIENVVLIESTELGQSLYDNYY